MSYCKSHCSARARRIEHMSEEERKSEKENQRTRHKINYQKNKEKILARNKRIYEIAKEYRDNLDKEELK